MQDEERDLCAHPECSCPAPADGAYCSAHCETAMDEVVCGCGHADCMAGVPVQSSMIV